MHMGTAPALEMEQWGTAHESVSPSASVIRNCITSIARKGMEKTLLGAISMQRIKKHICNFPWLLILRLASLSVKPTFLLVLTMEVRRGMIKSALRQHMKCVYQQLYL